jgi:hypothetical protein
MISSGCNSSFPYELFEDLMKQIKVSVFEKNLKDKKHSESI